jgi:autotransporter-associated beta strand protein
MKKIIAIQLYTLVLGLASLHSATLVSYDIPVTASGTVAQASVTTFNALTGVTASAISVGSGLTGDMIASGWGSGSWGWTAATTPVNQNITSFSSALSNGDYFQWSITAQNNYSLSLTSFGILNLYRSSTGPANVALFSSLDNYATALGSLSSISTSNTSPTSGTTLFGSNPITLNSNQTITFRLAAYGATGGGGTFRIKGNNTDAVNDFTILGTATSLSTALTWAGGNGTWALGSTGWGDGSTAWVNNVDANIGTSGTLTVGAGVSAGAVAVSTASGTTTLAGQGLTASSVTKTGAGTLALGNSGNTFANGVTLSEGTLQATANNVLSGNLTAASGTTVDIGTTTQTAALVTLTDANLNGTGTINQTGTTIAISTGTKTVDAALAGSGGLTKTGAGNLTLNGSQSYEGITLINGGTITTGAAELLSNTGEVSISAGANLVLGGNETIGAYSGSSAGGINLGSYTLTIQGKNLTLNSGGTISGTGGVVKNTANAQRLADSSTFTGGLVLEDGTLISNGSGSAASGGTTLTSSSLGLGTFTARGGRLQSSSTTARTYLNNVVLDGNVSFGGLDAATGLTSTGANTFSDVAGGATTMNRNVTVSADSALTWNQAISGSGYTLTKAGTQRMDLNRANTLAGVIVQQGALGYGNKDALGGGTVSLADGSSFGQGAAIGTTVAERTLANNIAVAGNVTLGLGTFANYLSGNVDLNGATRTVNMANATTFSGEIKNGGLNVVAANKTVSFTGASTYSGGTTFADNASGTSNLIYANNTTGSAFGSGAVSVGAGNILGGSGRIDGATTLQTGSGLRPGNSPGTLTFGSDLTMSTGVNMVWELWGNTAINSTTAYDQVLVGGNLLFAGSNGITLDFGTTVGGSLVSWSDSFWDSEQSWTVFDVAATTSGFNNLSILNSIFNDAAGASLASIRNGASFSISQVGNDVVVQYVPEPSTGAMLVFGLVGLVGMRALKRKA